MTKQELKLYSKVCNAYDDAIKAFKIGTNAEYKKAVNKLNKLRNEFYKLTGNRTEVLEMNI